MGWPGMAGKGENPMTHRGGRRRVRQLDLGASGGGSPRNFSGDVVWWWRSSLAGTCSKWVAGVASHGQNLFGLKWVETTQFDVHGFGEFSPGFWSSKWVCWG